MAECGRTFDSRPGEKSSCSKVWGSTPVYPNPKTPNLYLLCPEQVFVIYREVLMIVVCADLQPAHEIKNQMGESEKKGGGGGLGGLLGVIERNVSGWQ